VLRQAVIAFVARILRAVKRFLSGPSEFSATFDPMRSVARLKWICGAWAQR